MCSEASRNNPQIAAHRDVIQKIGVTGGRYQTRIANARLDPTFLLADVEVAATYKLSDINRSKLENLLHRVFAAVELDLEIADRFGNPVKPREWFLPVSRHRRGRATYSAIFRSSIMSMILKAPP